MPPKAVRAAPAEVCPVPPFAMASALVGVKVVAVNAPVLGLKDSLVDDTFAVVMLPVEALVKVR